MVIKAKKKRKPTKKKSKPKKPTLSKTEIKVRQKQRSKAIKKVISSSSGIITAAAVVGAILFVVAGPKLAIAGGGGILIVALSYLYPDMALWGLLIYLPFGGTVTYWIGGGSPIFQLAKDGFYFPALFAKYKEWKSKRMPMIIPKELKQPLMVLLAICGLTLLLVNGLQQLKPEGGDKPILLGLMGLKSFIGYLPLITCAYYQIKGKKELLFLTRLTLVLAIICCVLGVIQYQFLASGRCKGTDHLTGDDLFKATLDAKCFVGGSLVFSPSQNMIRLPGTFVAPWQWAWFLIANAFFTFASAFSDPSPLWRMTGLIGMVMVFINAVISGQRIALALVPVVTIILLVLTGQLANSLIETYYPKLIFEIGPIGVAGFLYLVTTMVVIGFKSYRSVKDKNLRSFGASFWVFVLIISYNTYYYPLDVDPVTVYYWYFAGVLFKLPEIDREERKKLIEAGELDPDI